MDQNHDIVYYKVLHAGIPLQYPIENIHLNKECQKKHWLWFNDVHVIQLSVFIPTFFSSQRDEKDV